MLVIVQKYNKVVVCYIKKTNVQVFSFGYGIGVRSRFCVHSRMATSPRLGVENV